jgi:hypothetical protein
VGMDRADQPLDLLGGEEARLSLDTTGFGILMAADGGGGLLGAISEAAEVALTLKRNSRGSRIGSSR